MSSNLKPVSKKNLAPEEWVSQAHAAEMRGVSRQAIAELVAKGRFKTLSIGGRILLKRSEIEAFKPKPPGPSPKVKQSKPRKAH
jgi:excisionase family DNA binding protein